MSLYVNESRTRGTPTIVFLHGAGTSGWMWQAQIDALQDFHCLNIDMPGHGKSNHIPWISMADTADQVAGIIREQATQQKAFVVGLSLGAYVTLGLLSRHSACVERAVLSGVTAVPLPNPTLMTLQIQVMSVLMQYSWFIKQQAKMLQIPDDVMPYYIESARAMSRKTLLKIFDELLHYHLPANLKQVTVPVLVSAGGSEVALIRDSLPIIASTLPQAEARIAPHLHHGWNGENPPLFTAMVRAWITQAPLPAELAHPPTSVSIKQRALQS